MDLYPMASSTPKSGNTSNSATVGFEATLWQAADKLRSNMDAAEYKHVVLGLIFLKYISDSSKNAAPSSPPTPANSKAPTLMRKGHGHEPLQNRDITI